MSALLSALEKEQQLLRLLRTYPSAALAYSGGVDSTYLAELAYEALGDNLLLLINDSPTMPREEFDFAMTLAKNKGWPVEAFSATEFEQEAFLENSPRRCYYCKKEIFAALIQRATALGITTLFHGENADDAFDLSRVGVQAAKEAGVMAPLADLGFTKSDIRQRSEARQLPTWDKAAFACLATRIPTGTAISKEILKQIERAESILRQAGFHQYRVRHHGELCRIEVEAGDFARFLDPTLRKKIIEEFTTIGYRHVTLDLRAYGTH